jgi:hypothetical protein
LTTSILTTTSSFFFSRGSAPLWVLTGVDCIHRIELVALLGVKPCEKKREMQNRKIRQHQFITQFSREQWFVFASQKSDK